MDVRPILLSFQTAIIAILFTFVLGTGVAYIVFRLKNRKLKILLNSLFTLPLVLPPTVFGFFLLTIFLPFKLFFHGQLRLLLPLPFHFL